MTGSFVPLVILGAPRSGTNMLRDALCRLPGFGTWPCDEINAIWRHGNTSHPTDELGADLATPAVERFVRRRFEARARRDRLDVVVEKTCANSLRVAFVSAVLPEARFVLLHRNPVDAVSSAILRWQRPFDLRYSLAKARFVPPSDLPALILRALRNRWARYGERQRRLAPWGPVFEGIDELLARGSRLEVCAHQWVACVERAVDDLESMSPDDYRVLAYEDFVARPADGLAELASLVDREPRSEEFEEASRPVRRNSVGRGGATLEGPEVEVVEEITAPGVEALNRLTSRAGHPQARARRAHGRNRRSS
ncbi:MAG: sulfotransferase [Acidobacteria bacterium]|nr:MAG: sulfotransferase [Acidobacteriota bacterium]REK04406.1 MAG: sulfotransferase [Acidobacteriota bacterium]